MADKKKKEIEIPVFSVLKKGSILKHIFLNSPPPQPNSSFLSGEDTDISNQEDDPILIGRHPDCHIVLDHPSISRFHLEVRINRAKQKLSVIDLSSVHGTWVSGSKIQPKIPVDLVDGDMMKLGASTRVYRLQWVTLSRALEMDSPLEALPEEKEETHQEEIPIPLEAPVPEYVKPSSADRFFSFPLEREIQILARTDSGESCRTSFCFVVPMQESLTSSFPMAVVEKNPSSLRLEKKVMPSSLLSRRSKSVGFLRIPAESKERIQKENDSEFQLCKVLFANLDSGEEEGEETFASDKENSTPNIPSSGLQRSSSDATADSGVEEKMFHSDEENRTHEVPIGLKLNDLILENPVKNGSDEEGEFTLDKEILTPKISSCKMLHGSSPNGIRDLNAEDMAPEDPGDLKLEKPIAENCVKNTREEEISGSDKENMALEVPRDLNLEKTISENCVENERGKETSASMVNLTPEISDCEELQKCLGELKRSPLNSITAFNVEEGMFDSNRRTIDLILKKPISENCEKNEIEEEGSALDTEILTPTSNVREETFAPYGNLTPEASFDQNFKKRHKDLQKSSLNAIAALNAEEEVICSDREKLTPEVLREQKLKKSILKNGVKSERKGNPFASDKENMTPDASGALKSKKPLSEIHARIEREIMKRRVERIPFQTLVDTNLVSFSPMMIDEGNNISNKSISVSSSPVIQAQRAVDESKSILKPSVDQLMCKVDREKKKWNIVVDTSCFLNEESRKSLQLLEGLKGTNLIIPRIVIRELDSMKQRESWFQKATKASSALKWIEECMVKASWWIHVQSSSETLPVASTPPASPHSLPGEGSNESKSSMAFSPCGSLMEIVSPTAEDHILDTALLFKRIRTDGQLVLLTNNITLKIKAMAEGLLCETPKEFRESLVNPYSKRFLWVESSPRGSTWSCSDQMGLIENNYHQCLNIKKTAKVAEGVKGLKVILLCNSHQVQCKSV